MPFTAEGVVGGAVAFGSANAGGGFAAAAAAGFFFLAPDLPMGIDQEERKFGGLAANPKEVERRRPERSIRDGDGGCGSGSKDAEVDANLGLF